MKYFILVLAILAVVFMLPELASAQPPGFPSAPDQAPIGGIFAVLAAAGGTAYALNKLRKRKSD